jgi:outer membrane receptor protein involved in Fe transport
MAIACLTFGGLAAAGDATAAIRKEMHIPAEGLGPALTKLAQDFDFQVLYRTEIVTGIKSPGAMGTLTSEEALGKLLTGTGLTYKYLDDKTVTIVAASTDESRLSNYSNASGSTDDANASKEAGKKSSQGFRLAQVDQGTSSNSTSVEKSFVQRSPIDSGQSLGEVVVTAQKQEQRLQDVPIPVSVINASALTQNNQVFLQDYYTQIPNLDIAPSPMRSTQLISIRGISIGGTISAPTVGIMVDGVPFGSAVSVVPDFDPGDLARIEVLRGPQGTLYGASSMGGLINYVTREPQTEAVSGQITAGTSGVYNGAEPGYNFRASVNIPLTDVFAIRASAFTRQDPGYIDNPVLHNEGINEDHANGGHLSAIWKPSDAFSVRVGALFQSIVGGGTSAETPGPGVGYLQQDYVAGVGPYDRKVQAYSAIVEDKLGAATITSQTGLNINESRDSFDATQLIGQALIYPVFGVTGAPVFNNDRTSTFNEELRLSVPVGERIDVLLGAFYARDYTPWTESIDGTNPTTGATAGTYEYTVFPSLYKEYAGFANLTFHLTDRFDVQVGGRESHITDEFWQDFYGPWCTNVRGAPSSPCFIPHSNSEASPFTYLLTPRFKLSPDVMVYARVASGFRPGGPNSSGDIHLPSEYAPDKTHDYDLGVKANLLDRTLVLDASLYYIDWKNIQIGLLDKTDENGYTGNAGGAKSEGVELSVESRPITGLKVGAWIVWSEAILTEAFPPGVALAGTYAVPGDPLPNSSRFSGNLSADQEFNVSGGITGFMGGTATYTGGRYDAFTSTPARTYLPPYARLDLHAGMKYDTWQGNLYANNVANRHGLISGGLGNTVPDTFFYITPRTVGLSVTKLF